MLALAGDTMMREGQIFPMVLCEGDQLPEAFHSEPGLLPHLHADHESRYPRAAVKHCLDDVDPPEDFGLEQRGIQLGKAPQRYTPLPSVKKDTFHGSLKSMMMRAKDGDLEEEKEDYWASKCVGVVARCELSSRLR